MLAQERGYGGSRPYRRGREVFKATDLKPRSQVTTVIPYTPSRDM